MSSVLSGQRFEYLTHGKTPASLENLIQWAVRNKVLDKTSEGYARDVQKAGNDYAHAYSTRQRSPGDHDDGASFLPAILVVRELKARRKIITLFQKTSDGGCCANLIRRRS